MCHASLPNSADSEESVITVFFSLFTWKGHVMMRVRYLFASSQKRNRNRLPCGPRAVWIRNTGSLYKRGNHTWKSPNHLSIIFSWTCSPFREIHDAGWHGKNHVSLPSFVRVIHLYICNMYQPKVGEERGIRGLRLADTHTSLGSEWWEGFQWALCKQWLGDKRGHQ